MDTDEPNQPTGQSADPAGGYGPPQPGFPQPGAPQPGVPQPGFPPAGSPRFPGFGDAPGTGDGPGAGPYGPYGPVPNLPGMPPGRFGRRRRGRLGCLGLLVILVIVVIAVYVLPNPWALHIGGRFTPLESWQGYGTVAASNGGHYVLYLNLRGGMANGEHGHLSCSGTGCDSLFGSAKLCTESGQTYTFEVTGAVHSWLSTDGARTSVDLTDSPPLPDGWVVALHGVWHGPALELSSPDNSFTEVFSPRGAIRTVTSTADAGTAQTTIRYGTSGDFTTACRQLAV